MLKQAIDHDDSLLMPILGKQAIAFDARVNDDDVHIGDHPWANQPRKQWTIEEIRRIDQSTVAGCKRGAQAISEWSRTALEALKENVGDSSAHWRSECLWEGHKTRASAESGGPGISQLGDISEDEEAQPECRIIRSAGGLILHPPTWRPPNHLTTQPSTTPYFSRWLMVESPRCKDTCQTALFLARAAPAQRARNRPQVPQVLL